MKQVQIYDQYRAVLNPDGSVLHNADASEVTLGKFNTLQEAIAAVTAKYNETKTLGTAVDKIVDLDKGYAEVTVTHNDGSGRSFVRVIYTKEV